MKKIFNFIRQNKLLILILVILIALFIVSQQFREEKTTQPPKQAGFNDLIPGISSESDLINKLGEPFNTTIVSDRKIFDYKSNSPVRLNSAITKENKIIFIKEIIAASDDKKSQDIINVYGNPQFILYNQTDPNISFNLYVYPDIGLAYIGHSDGGLLEIWYFQPTDISNFIKNWATNYSLKKPTKQVQ